MSCLDDTTISELVSGVLPPDREAQVKLHIQQCADCRALVAETAKSLCGDTLATAAAPAPGHPRGATIGRYVVLDVLGAGAMGIVYAAYDPRLDRKVALKLLHAANGGDGTEANARERLHREAKAMAKLSHPNVVAIHDVGEIDGRMFFAMEFVEGMTLARWLDHGRTLDEILDTFKAAGRGLVAAHAAGLVHRDFKPDNVLVASDGTVKVSDFGLARPIPTPGPGQAPDRARSNDLVASESSRTGVVAGTPAYLAPELWMGQRAGPLSDQFAFAVSLYEACYGERPFVGETIAELEASVLSGRVREPATDRHVPASVRRALLHAMSVRPEERFASIEDLLDALSYERKTRRRLAGVAMVLGVGLLAWFGYRARTETPPPCAGAGKRAAIVWDDARREATRRAFVATGRPFAEDAWRGAARAMDEYTSAWAAARVEACEATHVRREQSRELLERRIECLDRRLDDAAALVKVFSDADGQIVERSVEAAQSLRPPRECASLAAYKRGAPPPPEALAAAVGDVRAELVRLHALEKAGKYRDALGPALEALERARATGYLPLEAEALHLAGLLHGRLRDAARAEDDLRQAAEAAQAADHLDVAARSWIALVHHIGRREGRYDSAHQWTRFAAAAIEGMGGNDKLEADRLYTIGIVWWKEGRHAEALRDQSRALELYRKSVGNDDVTVARVLDGIAALYAEDGRVDKALELDLQALAIAERALGDRHPTRGVFLNNIGTELIELGRHEEALARLRDALAVAEETLGVDHPGTAPPRDNVGIALAALGRYDEAVVHVERAKAILTKAGKDGAPDYAGILNDAGEIYRLKGDPKQALVHHEAALALLERTVGANHPDVGTTLQRMGEALLRLGRAKEALEREARALDVIERSLGKEATSVPRVLVSLAKAHLEHRQPELAVDPLERALRLRTARATDPKELADTQLALASALWDADRDRVRARQLARAARDIFARFPHTSGRAAEVDAWLASR